MKARIIGCLGGLFLIGWCSYISPASAQDEPAHFIPVRTQGVFRVARIDSAYIQYGTNRVKLEEGDEIAIFDGDMCVGAEIIRRNQDEKLFPLSVSAILRYVPVPGDTLPGADPAHEMTFRMWDKSTRSELAAKTAGMSGGTFGDDYTRIDELYGDVCKITMNTAPSDTAFTFYIDHGHNIDTLSNIGTGEYYFSKGQNLKIWFERDLFYGEGGTRYTLDTFKTSGPSVPNDTLTYLVPDDMLQLTLDVAFKLQHRLALGYGPVDTSNISGAGWYDADSTAHVAVFEDTVYAQSEGKRWVFTEWAGGHTGTETEFDIVMDTSYTIISEWKKQFELSSAVSPDPAFGSLLPPPPGAWYDEGMNAVITARPNPGFLFTKLEIGSAGEVTVYDDTLRTIQMDTAKTAVAHFAVEILVTVTTSPSDLAFEVDGVPYSGTTVFSWIEGQEHEFWIPDSIQNNGAGIRYAFDQWSDGGARRHGYRVPGTNETVMADFRNQYKVVLSVSPGEASGSGWYDAGTAVTCSLHNNLVSLETGKRVRFNGWSGPCSDSGSVFLITSINAPFTETAVWKTQFVLGIEESPAEGGSIRLTPAPQGDDSISIEPYGVWYDSSTVVSVRADSADGWAFTGWGGDLSGIDNPESLTVYESRSVAAYFKKRVPITLSSDPPGRTILVDGKTLNHDSTFIWLEGSAHTLSVSDTLQDTEEAGKRYQFNRWSIGQARTHEYTVPFDPETVTAFFNTQYELLLNTSPGTATGAGWYHAGTSASFHIDSKTVPDVQGKRQVFTGWEGNGYNGTDSSVTVIMNQALTETARWRSQYYLMVDSDHGEVSGEGWYDEAEEAEFSVSPDTVYDIPEIRHLFAGWVGTGGGSYTGPENSASVTMNQPVIETAQWKTQYWLETATEPKDRGNITPPSPGEWCNKDTTVTVCTEPVSPETFYGYSGDLSGMELCRDIFMDGPKSVTAHYKRFIKVDVTSNVPDASFLVDGEERKIPYTFAWDEGSVHTLSVPEQQVVNGCSRYTFLSWNNGGGREQDYTVPSSDAVLSVTFGIEYYLAVESERDTPLGEGWHEKDTMAFFSVRDSTVTAGNTRYTFQGWNGDFSGSVLQGSLMMDGCKSVSAAWQTEYRLTLNSEYDTPSGADWYPAGSVAVFGLADTVVDLGNGERREFIGWQGSGSGHYSGPRADTSVVMNNPIEETAQWRAKYRIELISNPLSGGWVVLDPPDGWYAAGTPVEAEAHPASGYRFSGWSGDIENKTNPITLVMNGPKTITAEYEPVIRISVGTEPEGLSFEVNSRLFSQDTAFSWLEGEEHFFKALSPDNRGDTTRYFFERWSDGNTNPGRWFTVPAQEMTIKARYRTEHRLRVLSGHDTPYGGGWIHAGNAADFGIRDTLVYNGQREKYRFNRWESPSRNGYNGDEPGARVTMNNPVTQIAVWDTLYRLTVRVSGRGSVMIGPDKEWHKKGESIKLIAVQSDVSYPFVGWSGDASAESDTLELIMDRPISVNANFDLVNYLLSRTVKFIDPDGLVWPDSGGVVVSTPNLAEYPRGSRIICTSVPGSGNKFAGWEGALSGMALSDSFYIMSDTSVTAFFRFDDRDPPYVAYVSAPDGASNVPVNTAIILELGDDIYGVDKHSINLFVQGVQIVNNGVPSGDEVVLRSRNRGYQIRYKPSASFEPLSTVLSRISCRDLAVPPNTLSNFSMSFQTGRALVTSIFESVVPSTGASVTLDSGFQMIIPAGALDDSTYIYIGHIDDIPALPDSAGKNQLGLSYYLGPEGLHFSHPITITLPFPKEDLERLHLQSGEVIRVYCYSCLNGVWEVIPNVEIDMDSCWVTFAVDHFSVFTMTAWTPDIQPGQIINYPNPFDPNSGTTTIKYMLPKNGEVSMKIFDVSSSLVAVLESGGAQKSANMEYAVEWDGRNDAGRMVSNNVYFCVLSAGGQVYVRKIVVLR
ncbi:MAG TPA: hypothetical protein ENN03_03495 [bacterium]|nr:hypothetical protein [bacterium]